MANNAFGTCFFDEINYTEFDGNKWASPKFAPSNTMQIHPASHVLHYSSTCFEGLNAFRNEDGNIFVFRIDDHIKRMQRSAQSLYLPFPEFDCAKNMIIDLLKRYQKDIPAFPASAYIRPTLIGLDPAIGRAAAPSQTARFYILISPVEDYFSPDSKMRVLLNTTDERCAPHFGNTKAGSNYASALGLIMDAQKKYNASQVIFAPNNDVQETGAANCLLINDHEILTKPLTTSFLDGMTRDSILKVAQKLDYKVREENITTDMFLDWIKEGELALSGTAAVLAPVSEVVYKDQVLSVNRGNDAKNTLKLKTYLNLIQQGKETDDFNWLTSI